MSLEIRLTPSILNADVSKLDQESKKALTFGYGKYVSTSLESFMIFIHKVHNNELYKQTHNSLKDVEDLFELLSWGIKYDGLGIFDGHSYLHEPKDYSVGFKV